MNFLDPRLPSRFWDKVTPCPMSGCWLWIAYCDPAGYGRIMFCDDDGKHQQRMAHRVSYKALVGAIPADLELDHLCRVRSCCNPTHLEPVTSAENTRRGDAGKRSSEKTHCPQGHPYEGANLFFVPNLTRSGQSRCCRICKNERNAAWRAKQLKPLRPLSPELIELANAWLCAEGSQMTTTIARGE